MTPYKIVYADPAWGFDDKLGSRGAEANYSCMRWEDICMLELPTVADDALLFLWSVSSMLPEAIAVAHAWGFRVSSQVIWVKTKKDIVVEDETSLSKDLLAFGMGRTVRAAHETCLISTRGSYSKLIKDKSIRSVLFAPRAEHSRKPDEMYELIEKLTDGEGPYLEMFARRRRPGWVAWGHDVGVTMKTIGKVTGEQDGHSSETSNGIDRAPPGGLAGGEAPPGGGARGGQGEAAGPTVDPSATAA